MPSSPCSAVRGNHDSRAGLASQDEPAGIPPRMLAAEVGNWSAVAAGFDPATPAAVVSAGRITAVTPAAAAAGIRPGMRRRQAQTECPVLELAEHDPDLDARCFAPVVAALEDLTPRVEVLAPGCCVVATRGPSRYYGGDEALAELAHRTVTEVLATGTYDPASSVSVGIADGLFAAGMAGRAALARTPSTPVLVVPPGSSAEFLGGLPLGTLAEECSLLTGCAADGTTDDLLSMLWQLGLRTLGDLAALPVGDLVGRFGTQGEWMHALASGRDPRQSQPAAAHPDLSVETEIDPPADRLDTVAFAAKSLADQLDAQLAREGQALVCVEISAETEHGETCSGRWRHGFRFSPPDLVDRVRWQLDGWRSAKGKNSPTGGVSFIRLRAVETLPDEGRQLGFWGGQSEADERAERALQRVQTLVGFDGVTVGRLGSGRRFADLEQRLPFGTAGPLGTGASSTAGPLGTGASGPAPPWPGRLGAPTPAEVLAEPEPLVVLDANGDPVGVSGRAQASAPPAVLRRADGRTSRIAAWAGPWPLEERWWSTRSRRQARFQLVLDDGTAHLCAVESGRWQREATYD
ncbi:MAG: DNA polymerase Y family protein [Acidimicrobiales bacterium]|nr:DNA polymerase Y family protein [Acidimicrobiales bacterium]MYB81840.1 DNA polymerase Y family protein [Acidimicrobiales bacterium]MYI11919.1 DNA polymerase Y family protein [Acidimicrobiales bacterium]